MKNIIVIITIAICCSCSQQQYIVNDIQAQRYPVVTDSTIMPDPKINKTVKKYKYLLDKEMNQIIGKSTEGMTYGRPESLLTNLTSDVMLNYTKSVGRDCDISLMNVNGHRSNMPKGDITIGNIYEIYSFENALVWLQLKGEDLLDVFESYAKLGGAGLSSTAKLVIKNGKLVDAKIDGKPIDKNKIYSIVTLDYLAEGNDGMEVLKKANISEPLGITLRDVMLDYIKDKAKKGQEITSRLDGRISIEQ